MLFCSTFEGHQLSSTFLCITIFGFIRTCCLWLTCVVWTGCKRKKFDVQFDCRSFGEKTANTNLATHRTSTSKYDFNYGLVGSQAEWTDKALQTADTVAVKAK